MDQVLLEKLKPEQLDETVDFFLSAFQGEAFTATWLDLSRDKVRKLYGPAVSLKIKMYLEAGYPPLAALQDGRVVGVAIIKPPHLKIPRNEVIRALLPRLPRLLGLLPYVPRFFPLAGAIKPPTGLPRDYYTLEALAVHPGYQGRGVGRRLLEELETLSRKTPGVSGVYLFTGDEKNRQIYEKLSYGVLEARDTRYFKVYHMFLAF